MLTLSCAITCSIAALAGGFIDAISGGGGLLTIPALLLTGVPPHIALGTNKVSSSLGTMVSLANFAAHRLVYWKMAFCGIPFSLAGSWLGSLLALHLNPDLLGKILVGLIPMAMFVTLAPHKKRKDTYPPLESTRFWILLPATCAFIGCYDGFFGPATGSFLILGLHWILRIDLIHASATAKALNLASNLSAAASFIWHGSVFWTLGLLMGGCLMLGNLLGSAVAIKIGPDAVRKFLTVSLFLLLVSLIWQYFLAPCFKT